MRIRLGVLVALAVACAAPATASAAETITVSSTAGTLGTGSAGACTLRDALTVANATSNPALPSAAAAATDCSGMTSGSGSPYTIALASDATYKLDSVDNWWFGPDALPPISDTVTIEGNGATIKRASDAPPMRFFYVSGGLSGIPAGDLTLRDLTLTGGLARGGSATGGGGGAGMGGAIFTQGSLTIDHATLADDQAQGGASNPTTLANAGGSGGGGIGQDAQGMDGGGFGGAAPGAQMGSGGVSQSTGFLSSGGGGFGTQDGADFYYDGQLIVCLVCHGGGNGGFGGGPLNGAHPGDEIRMIAPVGSGDGGGGAQNLTQFPADGGDGGAGGAGGGGGGGVGGGGGAATSQYLHQNGWGGNGGFGGGGGENLAVNQPEGDGGFGGGAGDLDNSGDGSNSGGYGGGDASNLQGGGGAGMGGAVFSLFGTVTITESTLGDNTAAGGAPNGSGLGGALFSVDGTVTVDSSTIAGNSASGQTAIGGLYSLAYGNTITTGAATTASVSVQRSILYGNQTDDLYADLVNGDSANASTATVTGQDVIGAQQAAGGTAISGSPITGDPQLAALGDNGGAQPTFLPGPAGSAHGAGSSCDGTDEVGNARPGTGCDLGALELTTTKPTVATGAATDVGGYGATLHGTVNPGGAVTSYAFQLSDDGFTTIITAPAGQAGAGTGAVAVTSTISGLKPSTAYAVRLTASNSAGRTIDSAPTELQTGLPLAPAVATQDADGITQTTATLHGTVNPEGASTTFEFQISTDATFTSFTQVPVDDDGAGDGVDATPVSATATGLSASTTYYYRLVARNGGGSSTSSPGQQFQTLAPVPTITFGAPYGLTATTATLQATINPNGTDTLYLFEISTDPSFSSAQTIGSVADAGSGTSPITVAQLATGLSAGTDYYYRVIVVDEQGDEFITPSQRFTAGPVAPTVATQPPDGVTQTSATLHGTVTPNSYATSYHFELSTDASFASGVTTLPTGDAGDGHSPISVTAVATGLSADTLYYYRLVATSTVGTSTSGPGQALLTAKADAPGAQQPGAQQPGAQQASGSSPETQLVAPKLTVAGPVTVRATGSTVIVSFGASVACTAGATTCSAKLVATTPAPKQRTQAKKKQKKKPIVIARMTVTIPAGAKRALKLKLNATGRRLLKREHRLTATVRVTIAYGGPHTISTTHRLVLRRPAKRTKRPK